VSSVRIITIPGQNFSVTPASVNSLHPRTAVQISKAIQFERLLIKSTEVAIYPGQDCNKYLPLPNIPMIVWLPQINGTVSCFYTFALK
jgi:hypothetical protein